MDDLGVKRWAELGVVGTIYEEENEDSSSSTLPSLQSSPSFTPKKDRRVRSVNTSSDPDVVIYVQGSCFRLRKDALIARSGYLKRHLRETPELTLSPPLNITAQTFSLVTDFCYGRQIAVTPFNVAALVTAAELLGMTTGDESLKQITDAYFRRVVGVNKECACIVLRSCFPLLPEAETTASLVSRCIEALSWTDGEVAAHLECFKSVRIDDLKLILESASRRLTDRHDLLYTIVDIYLKENNGKVGEEGKMEICNYIDCNILCPQLIMHAVQNPRMPLRFVVQAMFFQQRCSVIKDSESSSSSSSALGAILERDAALGQVTQMKAVMSATNSRIQTLEKELSGMRKLLTESSEIIVRMDDNSAAAPVPRSASVRRFSPENSNKVRRGQTGSLSSLSYRDRQFSPESSNKVRRGQSGSLSSLSYRECVKKEEVGARRQSSEKKIGRRLINGLKTAFRWNNKTHDTNKISW